MTCVSGDGSLTHFVSGNVSGDGSLTHFVSGNMSGVSEGGSLSHFNPQYYTSINT